MCPIFSYPNSSNVLIGFENGAHDIVRISGRTSVLILNMSVTRITNEKKSSAFSHSTCVFHLSNWKIYTQRNVLLNVIVRAIPLLLLTFYFSSYHSPSFDICCHLRCCFRRTYQYVCFYPYLTYNVYMCVRHELSGVMRWGCDRDRTIEE